MDRVPQVEQLVEQVDWMSPIDYEILEFFESHDIIINPSSLAANIDYDTSYTAKRCDLLSTHDLLQKLTGPKYELTEFGRRFLNGKIDASELEADVDESG